MRVLFALAAMLRCLATAAHAQPPDAYHIYGIHTWSAGAGGLLHGRTGWSVELTHTVPIFWDLTHAQGQSIVNEGFTLMLRIDYDPFTGQTLPKTAGEVTSYASGCAAIATQFQDICQHYIIGNEYNASFGGTVTAAQAETAYRAARDAIHAVQPDAIVIVGVVAPYNATLTGAGPYPANRQWLNYFYDLVHRLGAAADGFAIHAYGGRSGDQDPRDDNDMGFAVYEQWMAIIESDPGAAAKPVYLTEMNHAVDGGPGGIPTNSYDAGFIQRCYEEIATWNDTHPHNIRAACWFAYANGGFPGYNISGNSQMSQDFQWVTQNTDDVGWETTGVDTMLFEMYR